jgi:hypothetical protein
MCKDKKIKVLLDKVRNMFYTKFCKIIRNQGVLKMNKINVSKAFYKLPLEEQEEIAKVLEEKGIDIQQAEMQLLIDHVKKVLALDLEKEIRKPLEKWFKYYSRYDGMSEIIDRLNLSTTQEQPEPAKEVVQLQLEELSSDQLTEIEKRRLEAGVDNEIDVMTLEEMELYKQNLIGWITNAEMIRDNSDNEKFIKAHQETVDRHERQYTRLMERYSSLKDELANNSDNFSPTQVELEEDQDGQFIVYGVQELADFLGWDKRRVSDFYKRDRIEAPAGRTAGIRPRPLWTPAQAKRIKEKFHI